MSAPVPLVLPFVFGLLALMAPIEAPAHSDTGFDPGRGYVFAQEEADPSEEPDAGWLAPLSPLGGFPVWVQAIIISAAVVAVVVIVLFVIRGMFQLVRGRWGRGEM